MISIYIRIGFRSLSTLDTHSEVVFDLNLNELTKTKGKSINEDNSDFLWSVGWISERYTNQDSSYNLPGRWSDKLLISLLESVHKAGLPLKIWKDKQVVYSLIRGVLVNTIFIIQPKITTMKTFKNHFNGGWFIANYTEPQLGLRFYDNCEIVFFVEPSYWCCLGGVGRSGLSPTNP